MERTDRFYEEARLPSKERATLEDYRGSGFDRGHMANARQRSSDQAMAQSFSLANMVPQAPGANRGSWSKSVEQASRNYAMKTAKGVYIYTGPLYEAPVKKLGKGKVWVPSATFKLMYDPSRKAAWGWILENKDDAKIKGVVSYEAMVKRTGIEFLPKDAVKN